MEENVQNNDYDEEISLIDLFAVLIRFRKLIILGTAIVTFLAAVYLYVLPKFKPVKVSNGLTVTYFLELNNLLNSDNNGLKRLGVSFNLSDEVAKFFENYPALAKEYKKYPFLGNGPENPIEFNQFIMNIFENHIGKKSENESSKPVVLSKKAGDVLYLECNVPAEIYEGNVLKDFVSDYVSYINAQLDNLALESIANSYREYEDSNVNQNVKEAMHDIDVLKNTAITFVKLQDEPFVVLQQIGKGRNNAKTLIIVFFAAAFLFVFIAFAKNAVINIKNDPESFQKISDAWNNGK